MTGITYFVALPFDVADNSIVVGEPIECPSPAAAIERAPSFERSDEAERLNRCVREFTRLR
jgi:hypothetical protein